MWNVFIRLRVGTSGSVLWKKNETLGSRFCRMWVVSLHRRVTVSLSGRSPAP